MISSIVVEFHNIATHHTLQLQNTSDFTLGHLSDTCLILASTNKDYDEDTDKLVIFFNDRV